MTIPSSVTKLYPGIISNCSSITATNITYYGSNWTIKYYGDIVKTDFDPSENKSDAFSYLKNSYTWER